MPFIVYACFGAGLTAALVAGVFQSFSDFVMAGLLRAAPAGGIDAMQQLNRTVFRSAFLASFIALVPVTLGIALYGGVALTGTPRTLLVTAGVVYVLSVFLVTAFGNVPMNERLDELAPGSDAAAAYWRSYGRVWTGWNHVRTLGSLATAACLLFASLLLAAE
ncbi:MAG: anthrone oxygenase family protein [Myxococcota bacterium]